MSFFHWLGLISQSAAPPGQPFLPSGTYLVAVIVLPACLGACCAGLIRLIDKIWGIKLGGGGV